MGNPGVTIVRSCRIVGLFRAHRPMSNFAPSHRHDLFRRELRERPLCGRPALPGAEGRDDARTSEMEAAHASAARQGRTWILHQKFEVPRWPCRIKAIVLVCESTTITNGVCDSGTGHA